MASDETSGAIVAHFLTDNTLTSVCPYMYAEELPEMDGAGNAVNPPFALVEVPAEEVNENFESTATTGYEELADVQITIFANTVASRDSIAAAFKRSYDWQPSGLTFASTNVKAIAMNRVRVRRGREDSQDAFGNRVFLAVLEYQAIVTK